MVAGAGFLPADDLKELDHNLKTMSTVELIWAKDARRCVRLLSCLCSALEAGWAQN
jgi:hypothetical protein